ncbi:MAG: response regulator [Sarcina sp.]
MYKVLIIEDDSIISREIKSALESWNYDARNIIDFKNIIGEFTEFKPDIVLLDISLPFFNGYHWCNEIRRISKVPIIFISSMTQSMNIVMAMNMGGDDFITKPFDLTVLVAKVQALIRRTYSFRNETNILENKDIIERLHKENINLRTNFDKNRSEMIDYYTLWVHQIKTPISAMNLILQHSEGQEKKELSSELFKVEEYVSMVLGYLGLSEGQSDIVINEYDLDKILRSSIKKYSRLFIRKNLSLNYEKVDLKIVTDKKWFIFGIEQILSNSIKYTASGGVSIYVRENMLYIEDTGIGIDSEDLPRIFDKGFTGYNGRINKKSTGLGLYLAKEIFNKLGYGIKIESEVGIGTKTIISINDEKIIDY